MTNERESTEERRNYSHEEVDSHEDSIIEKEVAAPDIQQDVKEIIDIPYDFYLLDKEVVDFRNEMLLSKRIQIKHQKRDVLRTGDDHIDINNHPSYTTLKEPYSQTCRLRYEKNWKEYNKEFVREIRIMEKLQKNAYETARYARILCYTTLWPPLHNRQETNKFVRTYFVHTPKDKARLKYLLNSPQI